MQDTKLNYTLNSYYHHLFRLTRLVSRRTLYAAGFITILLLSVNAFPANQSNIKISISTVNNSNGSNVFGETSFAYGEKVWVKIDITNNSDQAFNIPRGPGFTRPVLFHDKKEVPYRSEIASQFSQGEGGIVRGLDRVSAGGSISNTIELGEFFDSLETGKYSISVECRFFNRLPVRSNSVEFEVLPRRSDEYVNDSALGKIAQQVDGKVHEIDAACKVQITITDASGASESTAKKIYSKGQKLSLRIETTNVSAQALNLTKGPGFAVPVLLRNKKPVPYRADVNEQFARTGGIRNKVVILKSGESDSELIDLEKFFGALAEGKYQVLVERKTSENRSVLSDTNEFDVVPSNTISAKTVNSQSGTGEAKTVKTSKSQHQDEEKITPNTEFSRAIAIMYPGVNISPLSISSSPPNYIKPNNKEVLCRYWQAQADPDIEVDFEIDETDPENIIDGIGCLLALEGRKDRGAFANMQPYVSQLLPYPSVEVCALYYISFIYKQDYLHAGGTALAGKGNSLNSDESVKIAFKSYSDWYNKLKQVGLEKARAEKLEPLAGSGVRWY